MSTWEKWSKVSSRSLKAPNSSFRKGKRLILESTRLNFIFPALKTFYTSSTWTQRPRRGRNCLSAWNPNAQRSWINGTIFSIIWDTIPEKNPTDVLKLCACTIFLKRVTWRSTCWPTMSRYSNVESVERHFRRLFLSSPTLMCTWTSWPINQKKKKGS